MKTFGLLLVLTTLLTACQSSSYSELSSVSSGSPNASLAANPGIGSGASVTDPTGTFVQAGTTVVSASGTNLVYNVPALNTGTVTLTYKNTEAFTLQNDIKTYNMQFANMIEQNLPQVLTNLGDFAALTAQVTTLAEQYGLAPTSTTQRTTATNIISIANKITSGSAGLISFLTGIQATGSVPAVNEALLWRQHPSTAVAFCASPAVRD